MTAIGFLACETTLPGSKTRREDAFEHDNMIAAIEPALQARGWELRVVDWEAPLDAFDGMDLIMLGTSWNYADRAQTFLSKLEALEARGITVCNAPEIVRWNITKTYLRELAERGARTIPTMWLDSVGAAQAKAAFEQFGCEKLVVKRQVGAGAEGQELLQRGAVPADWHFEHPAMVQPFLSAIAEKGELSFLMFDGAFSHCVRKLPASGDYRIQSLYGGTELTHQPSDEEIAQVRAIIEALPFPAPLYARIDMLEDDEGRLMVMEAELIEPYLYPEQGPMLGENLANAIAKRLEL